jgi:hypothetical protein
LKSQGTLRIGPTRPGGSLHSAALSQAAPCKVRNLRVGR